MAKRRKNAPRSRPLVTGFVERIARTIFSRYPEELTELAPKQHGVYALYKGDRLYYVGLATKLKSRIRNHLKDRHENRWDRFSLYLVRKADHIKELESLILRVAIPKGNATKGRLPRADNLRSRLIRRIKASQKNEVDMLVDRRRPARKGTAVRRQSRSGKRGNTSLAMIGKRFAIRAERKGETLRASVLKDGTIKAYGRRYSSPSGAAKAVTGGQSIDGWLFWRFKKNGQWVLLRELRATRRFVKRAGTRVS